ncbi:hypothetical protein [Acinetobacter sp. TR11]|nr:hypothetical protein [Acinetobacter sp. TR11]WAU72732.1 hypothetical protein O1450_11595 [Acinetobacter sp. TR11]
MWNGGKHRIPIKLRLDKIGKGRLTGLGVGLGKKMEDVSQIWRMDYHKGHESRNPVKDANYFYDLPYHYHIRRAP